MSDENIKSGEKKNHLEAFNFDIEKNNLEDFDFDVRTKTPVLDMIGETELLEKIENGEKIRGLLPNLKWTHRTSLNSLIKILESEALESGKDRGIEFFLGNGFGYGEIQLIMKDSIMELPAAKEIIGTKVDGFPNMHYFGGTSDLNVEEFSNKYGEFRKYRAIEKDNPNINVPYLSIGGKNTKNATNENSVNLNQVEAVMIPRHHRKNKDYEKIKTLLKEKNITLIETETSESILDYREKALLLVWGNEAIEELDNVIPKEYAGVSNNAKVLIHLGMVNTDRVSPEDLKNVSIQNKVEEYEKESMKSGLSRGHKIFGGQWRNYVGEKDATVEEKAYLKYLVETRSEENKILKEGKEKLQEVFSRENFNYKELLDVLEKYFFPETYQKQVGLWEGYTLKEHTGMVLNQFEKYFPNDELPGNFDKNMFRLLLALHDIGKPLSTELGDTSMQHKYTDGIVKKFLSDMGMEKEMNKFFAIIHFDVMGSYVRGLWDEEKAIKNIKLLADFAGINAVDLFDLIKTYYKVDAGSYTEDAGGIKSLEFLFEFDHENNKLNFNSGLEKKMNILRAKLVK